MITVLSTKILSLSQRERLLHAGISVVAYDAIQIDFIDVQHSGPIANAIFTSQNAVRAIFDQTIRSEAFQGLIKNCFCLGKKTKALLEKNGQNVVKMAENASELGHLIVKEYKNHEFLFFHGNLKRPEIPSILEAHNVTFKGVEVYKTTLLPKRFDRQFDGILFFSPSAVQSFILRNTLQDQTAFCIGNTTATKAKEYTDNIVVAHKPTIENTIIQAIKYFKSDLVK